MPHFLYSTACGGNYNAGAYVSEQCHTNVTSLHVSLSLSYLGRRIEYRGRSLHSSSLCVILTRYHSVAMGWWFALWELNRRYL